MKTFILGAAAMLLSAAALAQNPAPVEGNPATLVHADSGAVTVQGAPVADKNSSGAQAGDVIHVTDGQATVTFANGCTVVVRDTYTVPATTPVCHTAGAPLNTAGTVSDGVLVAGGIGALVIVGAMAADSGGNNDQPSSP
jgi:hypothetical protein